MRWLPAFKFNLTPHQRNVLRNAWHRLFLLSGLSLVLIALIFSGLRLILPFAEQYRLTIEQKATQKTGYPVHIESIDVAWTGLQPYILLHDVTIGDIKKPIIQTKELAVAIDIFASVWRWGSVFGDIVVHQVDVKIQRNKAGEFFIQGIPLNQSADKEIVIPTFLRGRTLRVHSAHVQYQDDKLNKNYNFPDVSGSFKTDGKQHDAYMSMVLPQHLGERIDVGVELQGIPKNLKNLHGRFYINTQQVNVAKIIQDLKIFPALQTGRLNAQLWGEWNGELRSLSGHVKVENVWLVHKIKKIEKSWRVNKIESDIRWQATAEIMDLNLENLFLNQGDSIWPQNGLQLRLHRNTLGLHKVELAFDFLRAENLLNLMYWWQATLPPGFEVVQSLQPRLDLEKVQLQWDKEAGFQGSAAFHHFGIQAGRWVPHLDNVAGQLYFYKDKGLVKFSSTPQAFNYPDLFRSAWPVEKITGEIYLLAKDTQLEIRSRDLVFNTTDAKTRHWLDLILKVNQTPTIDMFSLIEKGDGRQIARYLPTTIMGPNLVKWLEYGVRRADVRQAWMRLKGDLEKFPFKKGEGIFRIDAWIENMELAYLRDWPAASDMRLHLRFENDGLAADIYEANINKLLLTDVRMVIPHYHEHKVLLQTQVSSELGDAVRYLQATSLKNKLWTGFNQLEAKGWQTSLLSMEIPYDPQVLFWAQASTDLQAAEFDFRDVGVKFSELTTSFAWNLDGIVMPLTQVLLNKQKAQLNISTAHKDAAHRVSVKVDSTLGLQEIAFKKANWLGFDRIAGRTPMQLAFGFNMQKGPLPPLLEMRSDLLGITSELPAPFNKSAEQAWPSEVQLRIESGGRLVLQTKIAQRINTWIGFESRDHMLRLERANIVLGDDDVVQAPPVNGLHINGQVSYLNVDQWLPLLIEAKTTTLPAIKTTSSPVSSSASLKLPVLRTANLSVNELVYLGRRAERVNAKLQQKQDHWTIELDALQGQGAIGLPFDNLQQRGIDLDFKNFNVDTWLPIASVKNSKASIDPRNIPPLRVRVGKLIFNRWQLNNVLINATPQLNVATSKTNAPNTSVAAKPEGYVFNVLQAKDPALNVTGKGLWSINAQGQHRSEFELQINSNNLGVGLAQLGYQRVIAAGHGKIDASINWQSSPQNYSANQLNGFVSMHIEDGELLELDAGNAGRVFGLLSVQALPRRLAFDFRDVFAEGFSFDRIKGDFNIAQGQAQTTNFELKAPAAKIQLKGRVGIATRDYDQRVTVLPDVSNTLPVIGTLVAGPVGGAGVLLVDQVAKLLGQDSDELGRRTYQLRGSWDNPELKPVDNK
ncbi:MAG: TIGR02099 family protein [Gammaproteobacteria bacterium]|nr:TIGR02099 family protein [Gammaproteobacteria bacterium]